MSENKPLTRVVVMSDHGEDPDDEYLLVLLAGLAQEGLIRLLAVESNQNPVAARASLAAGACHLLGLRAPVGTGADTPGRGIPDPSAFAAPHARFDDLVDGRQLLLDTLRTADAHSVELVLTSALTDFAELLSMEEQLVRGRLAGVTIMGGAAWDAARDRWVPDTATNNVTDLQAAAEVYKAVQEPDWPDIPVTVVTRYHGARVPTAFLAELAKDGDPLAVWLYDRHNIRLDELWYQANLPPDHRGRGLLPGDRDRSWYVENLLGGVDPGDRDSVAHLVRESTLHDVHAGLAAIERAEHFAPVIHDAQPHVRVIGVGPNEPGVLRPDRVRRRVEKLLKRGFRQDSEGDGR